MKTYGYYKLTHAQHDMTEAKEQLESFGCDAILTDRIEDNMIRPVLRDLLQKMKRGDTLVVYKFANAVRGLSQLTALLKSCETRNIRVVSTDDRIDTKDSISKNWQSMLGDFPSDSRAGDRAARAAYTANSKFGTTKFETRALRDEWVINSYQGNMRVSEICDRANIGRTSFFRILQAHGITPDRRGNVQGEEKTNYGGDTES